MTGATNGIGRAAALELARRGANLVLLGRDAARCEAIRAEVAAVGGGGSASVLIADLASQADVRRAAGELMAGGQPLHVLLNNAGVVQTERSETADGIETTFAVNHLAPFLLTNLLLPRIQASAPARVVTVSSEAHKFGGALDFDDLGSAKRFAGMGVSGRSKLANLLFTRELARRLEGSGVTANALHPGAVRTGLGQNNDAPFLKLVAALFRPFFRTPEAGADTAVWLCSAPEVAGISGRYFVNRRERQPHRAALDDMAARRLWDESAKLTGLAV